MMIPFTRLFPERRKNLETKTAIVYEPLIENGRLLLGADEYGFLEYYCTEPDCDCRQVMFYVGSRKAQKKVATIRHYFDPPEPGSPAPEQTFLDPSEEQTAWAPQLLDLFLDVVLPSEGYQERLLRHYTMVKTALADPGHPIHQAVAKYSLTGSNDDVEKQPPKLSRSGIRPPPPRRGKRKWR